MEHVDIPLGEVHTPHNWQWADAQARLAEVVTDVTLIDRMGLQLSDGTLWRLAAVLPAAVWEPVAQVVPWAGVTGKPETFDPSAHGHTVADVAGLQAALDDKQPTGSYIVEGDSRLTDARPASDVSAWAKAASKPTYTAAEVDAATAGHGHSDAITSAAGFMSAADKAKLDGVAAGATANASDAQLRDRSTHTGTQAISTVTGLQTALDGKQATLVSGTSIKTINGASVLGAGDLVVGAGAGQVPIGGAIFAPFTSPDYVDGNGTGWVRTGFPVPIKQSQVDTLKPVFPVNYVVFEQRTIPNPGSSPWISFAYGNGVFVGLTNGNNSAATSPDGVTWTQRTLPLSSQWSSITYGNGVFVAVSNTTSVAATSPDGVTWTQRTLPGSIYAGVVTYGNGLFVAHGLGAMALTSPDGITWTERTMPINAPWNSATYGNGLFVAVASNNNIAATSPDGITWTQRTLPVSSSWNSVTYGNGLFVAVASKKIAATSPDGITWTEIEIPPLTGGSPKITYGPQGFVYVMYGSNSVGFSPDGLTWVTKGLPTSLFTGMAYGNGLYLAFGYGSIIATSSDPASATSVSFGSATTQGGLPMFVRYL